MTRLLLCLVLGLSLLATSCRDQADEAPAAADAVPEPEPAAAVDDEAVEARYRCDGGNRVDLVHGGSSARVSMSDGRVVSLGVITGSTPRTWSDVGLRFVVDDGYAALSQDDTGRTLRCEPAGE
ncbi:hypothetical protein [Luteimonas sp. R10]|uniref:hypothetical protein n=1 Tax=Luteimonas sp. R10 TaxID=3108176 RepID=UPI00308C68A1|nr:hypothetical protein U3649_16900 [Luteimonas sp. R10]